MASASATCDLRLALAIALVKARSTHYASFQHWKKKAKSRKKELQTLQKILHQQQFDFALSGMLPLPSSCKCSFFESSERALETTLMDVHENEVDQLLFRQFLRIVNRWNYTEDCQKRMCVTGALDLDKRNQLLVTCKFLAELVQKLNPGAIDGGYIAAYAHQAVEFLQGTLRNILKDEKHEKMAVEGIITDLASQLLQSMLSYSGDNEMRVDVRSWIFQLLSKLGAISFVGQRILIMASDRFALVSERLCFADPFEENICQVNDNVMFVLQLIENLILYHSSCWKNEEYFEESMRHNNS